MHSAKVTPVTRKPCRAMLTEPNEYIMRLYKHLPDYLYRWTLLHIGRLHIRLHELISEDKTPFLHSHPFFYISIIFKGGYEETLLINGKLITKKHIAPTIVARSPDTYHRISKVYTKCKTIFFTWRYGSWNLIRHEDICTPPDYISPDRPGIYIRDIDNKKVFSKFDNGIWYTGNIDFIDACMSSTPSIHQCTSWKEYNYETMADI